MKEKDNYSGLCDGNHDLSNLCSTDLGLVAFFKSLQEENAARDFAKLLKKLNERQRFGVSLIVKGLQIMAGDDNE